MQKSEMGHFGSEENRAANAFEEVNLLHRNVGDTIGKIQRLSVKKKREVASDYLSVCVNYFGNHKDDYLRNVGITIFDAINNRKLKVETNKVRELNTEELQFNIEFSNEKASLIMPLEFIISARKQPVVALVSMLGAFSKIVDFLNREAPLDPGLVEERAEATQAHFLKGVGVHPEITSDPDCTRVLSKYPNGIFSLAKKLSTKN